MGMLHSLPMSQIAISTIDLRRSDAFWREGIGFLPSATTRVFRGRTISNLMRVENARTTTRWVIGRDALLQIEIWQFENPVPSLMDPNRQPNHEGFSRCGVWVQDFEGTAARLAAMGYPALAPATGEKGKRRLCVRDPDGIFVELFEQDVLGDQAEPFAYECNAALRSVTLTTTDFDGTCRFLEEGLGLLTAGRELHEDGHEALWGLAGARCRREVYRSGKMLVEVAHYASPSTVRKGPHERLIDQGILNVAFLDSKSVKGIRELEDQTIANGAAASERMVTPLGGCVYVTDPQGFNFELTWASRLIAQRVAGYFPMRSTRFATPDNRVVETRVEIDAPAADIWSLMTEPAEMTRWRGVGKVSALRPARDVPIGPGSQWKVTSRFGDRVEEVTHAEPGCELRTRAVRRSRLDADSSEFRLGERAGRTQVIWRRRFRSRWFGAGPLLSLLIARRQQQALRRLTAIAHRPS